MNLDSLYIYLKSLGDRPVLRWDDQQLPEEFQNFLSDMPNKGIALMVGENGIHLSNDILTIIGTTADDWPVVGTETLMLDLEDLTLTITDGIEPIFTGKASARMPIGSRGSASIAVTYVLDEPPSWKINFKEDFSEATPREFIYLGGNFDDIPFSVPPQFTFLDSITLLLKENFELVFYPSVTDFPQISYSFSFDFGSVDWNIIPGLLEIKGISLRAILMSDSIALQVASNVPSLNLLIAMSMDTGNSWSATLTPLEGESFPGIFEMANWIGGQNLSNQLSSGLQNLDFQDDLAISKLEISFNWNSLSLNYLNVTTLLTVGALNFNTVVSFPNLSIIGGLNTDQPITVKAILASFNLGTSGVPEDLVIVWAQMYAQPAASVYSIGLMLSMDWTLGPITLTELGGSVIYNKSIISGELSAIFSLSDYQINFIAAYDTVTGWQFNGALRGSGLPIGDVISFIAEKFQSGTPPAWMNDVVLKDVIVTARPATSDFGFSLDGEINLASGPILISVTLSLDHNKAGYTKKFGGSLAIGSSTFLIEVQSNPSDSHFEADWSTTDPLSYLRFADIATAFGFDPPEIPTQFDLNLKAAKLYYDFTTEKEALLLSAESDNGWKAIFTARKINGAWAYVIGIDISPSGIKLDDLPLVGPDLTATVGEVSLKEIKAIISLSKIPIAQVKLFNDLIATQAPGYPTLPVIETGIQVGVYAAIDLLLGNGNSYEMQVSTAKVQPLPPKRNVHLLGDGADDKNASWVNLQKTFGPVYLNKAGVLYQDGKLSLLLDASLLFSALRIDLNELGVSTSLTKVHGEFSLNGITISYDSGPVKISGGFLRQHADTIDVYNGIASIVVKSFGLSAMGSYAYIENQPSLFVFALLTANFGGPPCFFVTGIAAGFGYNRALKLPDINGVASFPLVQGFVPGQNPAFKGPDPGAALDVLNKQNLVPLSPGSNWVAVGLQFTSFQLISSYALMTLQTGTNLEVGLLGLSTLTAPTGAKTPLAYAQLALNVTILPDQGVMGVNAQLTPASYILSKSCNLNGGFAFYLWTSPNDHSGDFVVTLGGYHPNFSPPAHYPTVPRLGFNWVLTKELYIKGGIYFAITPSCLMAGGLMEAVYSSGDIRAWFTMEANFLIAWKPYHYQADMYIGFGVSYTFKLNLLFSTITKTIAVELSARLDIWGPDFSGIAHIKLWIVSFDISFGAAQNLSPDALSWNEFLESFLPPRIKVPGPLPPSGEIPTDSYCYTRVKNGLVQDVSDDPSVEVDWIVLPNLLSFETTSIFPCKTYEVKAIDRAGNPAGNITYANSQALSTRNQEFGVGMVQVENGNFVSVNRVELTCNGTPALNMSFVVTGIFSKVPKSLWQKGKVDMNGDAVLGNILTGFTITPLAPVPNVSLPIDMENFQYDLKGYETTIIPSSPTFYQAPEQNDAMRKMQQSINDEVVSQRRKEIIESLIARGVLKDAKVNVADIASEGNDYLMAPPVLSYTYWKADA